MDVKDRNGLMFGYIQKRPQGLHHLIDIFRKLYKDRLTESSYRPNNNGTIKTLYPYRGFQSLSSNLEYNRENIDQDQYIYRSDTMIESRLSHILRNNNEDIQRPEKFNIQSNLGQ